MIKYKIFAYFRNIENIVKTQSILISHHHISSTPIIPAVLPAVIPASMVTKVVEHKRTKSFIQE